ncbi:MAG: NYN domain-containing protein [Actinobacteria bacterium]|nr:MAG: NYN domain-containing protein [Actinomycetota bacterium]TMM12156.1 MAG: NYN domain-containing protein [Actinomycetota bacterium]
MRWLVDGMNVIGSRPDRWWRDRPAAMRRLVGALAEFARESGVDVTVVFDGRPPKPPPEAAGVEVVFARRRGRNAADDEIARLVADDPAPDSIRVVTSDNELAERVREHGADVEGAGGFRRRLERESAG